MVVGLIFAAAVSAAAAKPLFVPPKGMALVSAGAALREELSRVNGQFVREYRAFAKVKPSWSEFTYKVPESITIIVRPTDTNAAEWGVETLADVEAAAQPTPVARSYCRVHHCVLDVIHVKVIASQPIALCNGKRGWLNAYTRDDQTFEQLFVRSDKRMYLATLQYQTAATDQFRAGPSLRTLCPPNAGELAPPKTAVPFTVPAGWKRSTSAGADVPEFTLVGSWYRQTPKSFMMQGLQLLSASDVSEYTTPQQMADMWKSGLQQTSQSVRVISDGALKLCSGADGWFTIFRAADRAGRVYTVEAAFGYGKDTLYALQYMYAGDQAENSAVHDALRSLCPPHAARAL